MLKTLPTSFQDPHPESWEQGQFQSNLHSSPGAAQAPPPWGLIAQTRALCRPQPLSGPEAVRLCVLPHLADFSPTTGERRWGGGGGGGGGGTGQVVLGMSNSLAPRGGMFALE